MAYTATSSASIERGAEYFWQRARKPPLRVQLRNFSINRIAGDQLDNAHRGVTRVPQKGI